VDLAAATRELAALDPIFHHPEPGMTPAHFAAHTAEDFWEAGTSGVVDSRDVVWADLARRFAHRAPDEWEARKFRCRAAGSGASPVTHLLYHGARVPRRVIVGERSDDGCRIVSRRRRPVPRRRPSDPRGRPC